jgi:predicted HAD superfamily Cof-like phosphohydrolase
MEMNTIANNLASFHSRFCFDKEPMTISKLHFRTDLLMEEISEMHDAIDMANPEEFVDSLIDIIYIAAGTLDLARVDIEKAWQQVHSANMTKIRGVKLGREQSGGFDVIKPVGWVAPSHCGNHGIVPFLMGLK